VATKKTVQIQSDDGLAYELPIIPPTRGAKTGARAKRPRGSDAFSERLPIKLTTSELVAWRRFAAAQNRSVSAVVRSAMAAELAAAVRVTRKAGVR
jgi:hypothetical protein